MTQNEVLQLASQHSQEVAPEYGADPAKLAIFLTGIAQKESNFNPDAKNKNSTARGLMQMLIGTQREVEKKRAKIPFAPAMYKDKVSKLDPVDESDDAIFDPDYAMELAAWELAYQAKRYNYNWRLAVHAYNQGSYPGTHQSDGKAYANSVFNLLPDDTQLAFNSEDNNQRREFY